MLEQKFLLGRVALCITIASLIAKPVLAATGTIGLYAGTAVRIEERTSNITGPSFVPNGQIGHFTATFPSGMNNQSGSFTALLSSNSDPDATCAFSFVTIVSGGKCSVSVGNSGTAACGHSGVVTNATTCDFSVNLDDNLR